MYESPGVKSLYTCENQYIQVHGQKAINFINMVHPNYLGEHVEKKGFNVCFIDAFIFQTLCLFLCGAGLSVRALV